MGREIVHDHHLARLERRNQESLDEGHEHFRVDSRIKAARRADSIYVQRCDRAEDFPVAMRCSAYYAPVARPSCIAPRHVGGSAKFINEHKLIQLDPRKALEPAGPRFFDIRTFLLGGMEGLFFKVNPRAFVARHTVGTLTL